MTAPTEISVDSAKKLPDLHQAILDAATLQQLSADIIACTELLEVIPKYAGNSYVQDAPSLTIHEGIQLLATGELLGLQLRYRYEGALWWDTLMRTPAGIRLVRIQHNISCPTV